jgi:predicted molibdopterin-dependent oxidoreductase YjgC
MDTVELSIDGRKIEAAQDAVLLQVCLQNDIYVPNLCHLDIREEPPASCRLCFVEIEGRSEPVTACTQRITTPLTVRTDTPRVRHLQRSALKLLLSVHQVACRSCPANRRCELQRMARILKTGLHAKPLANLVGELRPDTSHPFLDYHPYRCVLCGRCVAVCRHRNGSAALAFARRGFDTVISSYGAEAPAPLGCPACQACVDVCPVAALTPKI